MTLAKANHPRPESARWLWPELPSNSRTSFVLFRRDFALESIPLDSVPLNIMADSRYRLSVNGQFITAGPARFVTSNPEYDTIDLREYLVAGQNCVVVEVNAFGCSSFQTMPDSRGGFIAWGGGSIQNFSTPGAWHQRVLTAWDSTTSLYSFAQAACEVCDTAKLNPEWWLPGKPLENAGWTSATALPEEECIWGELALRTAPVCPFTPTTPARIEMQGLLADDRQIVGVHFPEQSIGHAQSIPRGLRLVFQTWFYSPRHQTIELGVFWGQYWLNGQPLHGLYNDIPGIRMRGTARATLHTGWNCFCGTIELLNQSEFWDLLLDVPRSAGIRISSHPDTAEEGVNAIWQISPLVKTAEVDLWLHLGTPIKRDGWKLHDGSLRNITPARQMGWTSIVPDSLERDLPMSAFNGDVRGKGRTWVFKFETESIGHIELDIEGPVGTIVDVGYDEWLRQDGQIDLYRTNPFVHTVDRYFLRGGRQKIIGFNPRGGRYIQIMIQPGLGGVAHLHGVSVLSTKTIDRGEATFNTNDDELLKRIWESSVMTLVGSAEDAYSDSPWRERGTYIGDFTVNQKIHRLLSSDLRSARRAIKIFAQARLPDGQLPAVAPACHRGPHEDFTLLWIVGLWEYWSMTGDTETVAELWPIVEGIWASPSWGKPDSRGLWHAEGRNVFIDWGVISAERSGNANAVLNAFRIAALDASSKLAGVLGLKARGMELRTEADQIREAYAEVLWRADVGRYAAYVDSNGHLAESSATHANVLAWVYRIGSSEQISQLKKHLVATLPQNFELGILKGQNGGHLEVYYFRFFLDALAERGQADLALALIRQHWGFLVEDGFGTLPECFCRRDVGNGSRCHSWSGYPAVFLNEQVLGLRQTTPGDTDHWIVDPIEFKGINQAEGIMAHAKGFIHVRWKRLADNTLDCEIKAPEGVTVKVI